MTKRNPDKREQNRLKKIEDGKQKKRYLVAKYVSEGHSYRVAARKTKGVSHQFVKEWATKLLDSESMRIVTVKDPDGRERKVRLFNFKKGYRKLLATRKPGPDAGNCPKA